MRVPPHQGLFEPGLIKLTCQGVGPASQFMPGGQTIRPRSPLVVWDLLSKLIARFLLPDCFAYHSASTSAGTTPHWHRGVGEANVSWVVVDVVVVVVEVDVVSLAVVVVGLFVVVGLSVGLLGLAGRAGLFGLWLQTTLQVQPSVLPMLRPSFRDLNTNFTVLLPEN